MVMKGEGQRVINGPQSPAFDLSLITLFVHLDKSSLILPKSVSSPTRQI